MAAIRRPLTYSVPDGMEVWPGQRVQVPLGKRSSTGIALEPVPQVAPGIEARPIQRVLDVEPILSPELLALGLWIAEYYLAPVGEVFRAMLPIPSAVARSRRVELTPQGLRRREEIASYLLFEERETPEAYLLQYVEHNKGAALGSVRQKFGAAVVEDAVERGLLRVRAVEHDRRETFAARLAPSNNASTDDPAAQSNVSLRGLSPVARRVVEALQRQGPVRDHRDLLKASRATLAALKKLREKGVIELADSRTTRWLAQANEATEWTSVDESPQPANAAAGGSLLDPSSVNTGSQVGTGINGCNGMSGGPPGPPELNSYQSTALAALRERLERREFGVVLLHGITGSGKTEVYLHLVALCLEKGAAAMVLVPEIALTPSVLAQFKARFGSLVALLHSSLGRAERQREWWRLWRGEARVALGTRSAVFAPIANLGLVIVDEEHDSSYKQDETPRYHGRDAAVMLARLSGALALLGSATPSLESYWNTQQGKYQLLTLEKRVAGRPLASVDIIDMRQEFRETHTQAPVSRRLRQEIEAQLANGSQTMLLLNRRGYSWFVLCRSCGETLRCVNCSISLTYHRREHRMVCHYCGYRTEVPQRCPSCNSEYLHYVGEGTEKLEDKIAEMFPAARVARLDRDVVMRTSAYLKLLTDFHAGHIDILVGTQMIAKGHDFPGVTLVGVVSADMGLGLPDFRSAERTFQLLTQAAGRAGRGDLPGRVLVQTFYPEHYAIRFASDQNYPGFFSKEMSFRRVMHYPPANAMAHLLIQDQKLEVAAGLALQVGDLLKQVTGGSNAFRVMGPQPAPLARIERQYRIQFLIKAASRTQLNQALQRLAEAYEDLRLPPRALIIDMDPVSTM